MIGLTVLVVAVIYLAVLVWATWAGYLWAKRRGLSKPKCWLAASGGFLVVYLPVFWDHIPTVVAHNYYCEKEAGFWVYKTLDQWKKENSGVFETLIYEKKMPHVQTPYGGATVLNQRFLYVFNYEGPLLLNRWKSESEIRDAKTGEVIAREIDFSTSQERRQAAWSGWKIWLDSPRCDVEKHRDQGSFDKVTSQFEGAKK
jgi:hypothetical protein